MFQVMKDVIHGSLEGGSYIFQAEWHYLVCECAPRGSERNFVPVSVTNLNLIVPRESIHEGEGLMTRTSIDNLVDEWGRVIFLWTCFVQIAKIGANTYGDLFFC